MARASVSVSVELGSRGAAESLLAALTPDNVGVPGCMELSMGVDSTRLIVSVSCDLERADTLASTVGEILDHIRAAALVLRGLGTPDGARSG
ncbi:MAG: hypothetical protein ACP5NG_01490 [Conexivisphaera sp.]